MATLVAVAVADYLGLSAFWAAVATAAGTYVDSTITFPHLFPRQIETPKIGTLRVQSGEEGTPIKQFFGPRYRTAGQVIWVSDLITEEDTSGVGGKGGGGASITEYDYFRHVAVAVGEGEISNIVTCYGDGKWVFTGNPNFNLQNETLAVQDNGSGKMQIIATVLGAGAFDGVVVNGPVTTSDFVDVANNGTWTCIAIAGDKSSIDLDNTTFVAVTESASAIQEYVIITGPGTGYSCSNSNGKHYFRQNDLARDLSRFEVGDEVTISGYTGAHTPNNGTFTILGYTQNPPQAGLGGPYIDALVLDNPNMVGGGYLDTVTAVQVLPSYKSNRAVSIRFYKGDDNQVADGVIVSEEGSANVPGYRHICYVVIQKLALKDFGNRVPNLEFIVEETRAVNEIDYTLADAVTSLFARAGILAAEFDVTDLSGIPFPGGAVEDVGSVLQTLFDWMVAYDLIGQVDGGVIRLLRKDNSVEVTVPRDDMAAHAWGSDTARVATFRDKPDRALPTHVEFRYIVNDPEEKYQFKTVEKKRFKNHLRSSNVQDISPAVTLNADDAEAIALRLLWDPWNERITAKFGLPPSYLHIQEGDTVVFTDDFREWKVLVTTRDVGSNYILECEGQVIDSAPLNYNEAAQGSPSPGVPETVVSKDAPPIDPIDWELIDIAPFSDAHVHTPGFYIASSLYQADQGEFIGGILYETKESASTPEPVGTVLKRCPKGDVAAASPNPLNDATPGYWDRASTVTVVLQHGTLESRPEIDVLNGANTALIGNEVVGFANATLVDTNTYELDTFIRGLCATEDEIGQHNTSRERFVLISSDGPAFKPVNQVAIGQTRNYRIVTRGGIVASYSDTAHTIVGATVRPFDVCHVAGERDGSSNLTISWVRRSRGLCRVLSETGVPLLEPYERYEVDILDGADVVRTLYVEDATSVVYSAAQQTTDFGSTQSSVSVKIYQMGDLYGRGKEASATV